MLSFRPYLHGVMAIGLVITLSSCDKTEANADEKQPPAKSQCFKDTECKGERICENGKCVEPLDKAPQPVAAPKPKEPATKDNKVAKATALCVSGDKRKRIAVWTPSVDDKGNLSSDPPTGDGSIAYIELYADVGSVQCNDEALNSFSRPADKNDAMQGGLAVNIRGNTQFANGTCYIRGYFMNEDVMGMHQGWIETYFGAVEKEKIVLSSDFCLARALP